MSRRYVPARGDVVWISLDPQAGHEQAGRRPALVVSPAEYNAKVRLALVCPVTSQIKDYPFEVRLPVGSPVHGVVLSDHLKSLDWQARKVEFIGRAPDAVTREVLAKAGALLSLDAT